MDYFSLRCFLEVVRTGSFSKASRRLFRTQPAISLQIKKLEEELGVPLIDRYKRAVTLTENGRLLYEHAQGLVDEVDSLKRVISESIKEPRGPLTIATNLSLINNFLPEIVGKYHEKYPKVHITLLNFTSERILAALLEGRADLGVGFRTKTHPEVAYKKIKDAHFCLVCQRKDPLIKQSRISAKHLLEGNLVHFEAGIDLRSHVERGLKAKTGLAPVMELPSIESILNYIYHGFGYSILPDFSISDYWNKRLAVKRLGYLIAPIGIFACFHKKKIMPKTAKLFLEMLRTSH